MSQLKSLSELHSEIAAQVLNADRAIAQLRVLLAKLANHPRPGVPPMSRKLVVKAK